MTHPRRRYSDRWNWMEHLAKILIALGFLLTAIKQYRTDERVDRHKEEIERNTEAIQEVAKALP